MITLRPLLAVMVSGLFMLPTSGFAAGQCERLVVTGSPDTPPYLWRDPQDPKHLIGANADVFKQIARSIGLNVEVLYAGDRSQAVDDVHAGRMDMLIDAPLIPSELESVDYVHPALIQRDVMLMAQTSSPDLAAQPLPSDNTGLYLALSFNSACNEAWLRGQLAKKMTELAASGLAGEAVRRNLELWKSQSQPPASVPNK